VNQIVSSTPRLYQVIPGELGAVPTTKDLT
jgi:hypothetical protein